MSIVLAVLALVGVVFVAWVVLAHPDASGDDRPAATDQRQTVDPTGPRPPRPTEGQRDRTGQPLPGSGADRARRGQP